VAFKDLSVGSRGASAVISLLNVPDWAGAKRQLLAALPTLDLVDSVAVVSVVGDGLAGSPEPLRRFLAALRGIDAAPLSVTAGALRLGAVIAAPRAGEAQRALHAAFVAG
jgi:aspartate kinase